MPCSMLFIVLYLLNCMILLTNAQPICTQESLAAMRGNARQCAAMRGNAWQCAAMRGNARQCAAMRGNARQCAAMCGGANDATCALDIDMGGCMGGAMGDEVTILV
jgi:hypothetical protein